jgi:hypothetical protein
MASVEPVMMSALEPHAFAQWSLVFNQQTEERGEMPMLATCHEGTHGIWMLNALVARAWPVAWPSVRGSLLADMKFIVPPGGVGGYSPFWRSYVRAMFYPRLLDHLPACRVRRVKESAVPSISTVGTFEFGGLVYAVEWHPDEIRVTDAEGQDVAFMAMSRDLQVGEAVPGRSAPSELLDRLRQGAIEVLRAAAVNERGPWALSKTA